MVNYVQFMFEAFEIYCNTMNISDYVRTLYLKKTMRAEMFLIYHVILSHITFMSIIHCHKSQYVDL